MAHCITEKLKEDRCNNMICMQFTISPSILTGHWSRVLMWQVYTLWQRVSRHRGRGVSGNKDVLTQLYPSSHFTFLHFAASFASFRSPLPLSGLTLLLCYWPTLLPSVLRNFRYSDILGIISAADERVTVIRDIVEFKIIRRFRRCLLLSQEREGEGQTCILVLHWPRQR